MRKILIIGGTGSLGFVLTKRYLLDSSNDIYLYSRDECKHWSLGLEYGSNPRIHFIIGNINDKEKITQTILRHDFEIIILAAAMKHIDQCEFESNECMNTNLNGTQNVLNVIETYHEKLSLKKVCFISTDKACSPVNIYGMCKAISELLVVEKAKYISSIKFVCVRYGNVLNSRGSIIPLLHKMGKDKKIDSFTITDERMTRFVMTLEQSVDLVFHALDEAESGDIVIPKLVSCNIKDMVEIFAEIYDKKIKIGSLRPGEKMLESLINETQARRLVKGGTGYFYIKPVFKNITSVEELKDYNSTLNPLTKLELKNYLKDLKLI
jgi:FlaA1/EpsC-like NDP-sugar epimerase